MLWLEEPRVTRARVLLVRGTESDLRMAQQILDVLDEIVERTHNTRYKIEISGVARPGTEGPGGDN